MIHLEEWRRLTKELNPEFFARTTSPHPKPEHVDHAFSARFPPRDGIRYHFWAFTTKESYEHFIALYQATVCTNPGEEQ